MDYLVSVDDTDMPGTKGTGWIVQEMCEQMEGVIAHCSAISRHQLFLHDDVPYTSHNSAMCFEMNLLNYNLSEVVEEMIHFIKSRAEEGSDPGVCVAKKTDIHKNQALLDYGRAAKKQLLSKDIAYSLAEKMDIHLSEHGGTGDGVIGALAAVGLRLSGNDGRYRGWYHLGNPGTIVSVEKLCGYSFVDQVITESGEALSTNISLAIGSEKIKTVRKKHLQVVVVKEISEEDGLPLDLKYRTITSREAKAY